MWLDCHSDGGAVADLGQEFQRHVTALLRLSVIVFEQTQYFSPYNPVGICPGATPIGLNACRYPVVAPGVLIKLPACTWPG